MTTTKPTTTRTERTPAHTAADTDAAATSPGSRTERLSAGIGAVGFATVVLATNAIVGATPAWDAPASEVVAFVEDKHAQLAFSAAAFAVGMPFLVSFICGIAARLRAAVRPEDRVVAHVGLAGALLILPFFAAVVVQRIVLTVGIDERIGANADLVAFAWRLEGAAFAVNLGCIGVALLGLGRAASRAGLLPRWFGPLTAVTGTASIVGAALAVPGLEGAPTMALGLAGFVTWMLLLLTIGIRQLRAAD
jgi:hypothetical protein